MPVWEPSLVAAGFDPDTFSSVFHKVLLSNELDAAFLLAAGPIGDILPIPVPVIRNVASIGDLFLTAGLGFFLFATVLRSPAQRGREPRAAPDHRGRGRDARQPRGQGATSGGASGRRSGWRRASRKRRRSTRRSSSAAAAQASGAQRIRALVPVWEVDPSVREVEAEVHEPTFEVAARICRRHLRPARPQLRRSRPLDGRQLISLFGDRVNQIALALVLGVTGSPVAVAFVFVAATLPNLFLSPIAGTYVDRWDQKDVMVVSDLLRRGDHPDRPDRGRDEHPIVYPLVFAITSISIFFRPARVAALPRIVRDDELLTANSAMWIGETIADIVGYPAAIFVGFLGSAPLAFWLDAATYAASAALIANTIVVLPLRRTGRDEERPTVLADLKAGYRFRNETVLLANTLQATVGQFTLGVLTALTPTYALGIAAGHAVSGQTAYGFLETAIGVGNLIGGFVIGVIGTHLARGRTVIIGYTVWGPLRGAPRLDRQPADRARADVRSGVANMVFIIPSQTLFQERTPPEMLGRVVGFRFALVFGSMTIAMGLSGLFAQVAGVGPVIAVFGIMTMLAGIAGLFVPGPPGRLTFGTPPRVRRADAALGAARMDGPE